MVCSDRVHKSHSFYKENLQTMNDASYKMYRVMFDEEGIVEKNGPTRRAEPERRPFFFRNPR